MTKDNSSQQVSAHLAAWLRTLIIIESEPSLDMASWNRARLETIEFLERYEDLSGQSYGKIWRYLSELEARLDDQRYAQEQTEIVVSYIEHLEQRLTPEVERPNLFSFRHFFFDYAIKGGILIATIAVVLAHVLGFALLEVLAWIILVREIVTNTTKYLKCRSKHLEMIDTHGLRYLESLDRALKRTPLNVLIHSYWTAVIIKD